jgi:hypothetical protein
MCTCVCLDWSLAPARTRLQLVEPAVRYARVCVFSVQLLLAHQLGTVIFYECCIVTGGLGAQEVAELW